MARTTWTTMRHRDSSQHRSRGLALVHGTFGHPGIAKTTTIIERKYHSPTPKRGVRGYVLPADTACGNDRGAPNSRC